MKNLFKSLGIIVVVAIIGFTMAGCATATTIGGASGIHGFFTGNGAASTLTEGYQEIASYSSILGLFDAGYADYAATVKSAEDSGKHIVSVTKWLFVMYKITAYAK